MRLPRILTRYLLSEIVQYTLLGFVVFASLLLSQNLLRTLGDIAETAGASFRDLGLVAVYLIPVLTTYALPVSFLFGVLLAVGRLASDSEILAMRACGLGLRELVVPVVALGALVSLGTGYLMMRVEPEVRKELRAIVKNAVSENVVLEPGRFRGLNDRVIYVRDRRSDGLLQGIVIWDESEDRTPFVVFAERGRARVDTSEVRLLLEKGEIHLEPRRGEQDRYRRISFEKFDYTFDVSAFLADEASRLRPRDMTMVELRTALARIRASTSPAEVADLYIKTAVPYELQIHRRFALPFASIVFALIGVPLAMRRVRGARSFGAMLCVALAFAYYVLLSLAEFLSEDVGVSPGLALWLPNATFLAAAIPLLLRARRAEL